MVEEIEQLEVKAIPKECPVCEPCPVCPSKPKFWQVCLKLFFLLIAAMSLAFVLLASSGLRIVRKESLLDIWLAGKRGITPSPEITEPTPTPDPTADWKTYTNSISNFEFKYPENLRNLFSEDRFIPSVRTKQEIIEQYTKYKYESCPSTCGKFVEDPALLKKQFDILSNVASSPNCTISDADQEKIKKDFILFTGGIGNKIDVMGIKTKSGLCGLKLIEFDGYDVSLENFYYKTGFIIGDNVVEIDFPIFLPHFFDEVDNLWRGFGYDMSNNSCDASCCEKEAKYYDSFDKNNEVFRHVIETYDQILSTFKFLD